MIKNLILIFLSVVFLSLLIFLPPKLIKVNRIECSSQYGDCPSEINLRLESLRGKSLGDAKKETSKILSDNFLISDFSTQFKLSSTLKVNLVIRKAIFAVNQSGTDNYSLIDKDGWVVAIATSSSLPTVVTAEKLKNVGEKVSDSQLFSLRLVNGVYSMYQVNRGEVKDDSLVVELPSSLNVIFPIEGDETRDVDYYLGILRLIVTKIEAEEGVVYREIDLRFKNPVLR